jgi:uncharacterized delta-60 repeat protein
MGILMWSLLAAWATASAADGEPDPLFGQNGVVTDRVSPPPVLQFNGAASAIDAEGRILVGAYVFGTASHPGGSTLIARYLADGTRDPYFGTAGMTTFTLPGGAPPNCVVVQPDGSMIVVGTTTLASQRQGPFVARLTPWGWPDHAFGQGGFRVVDLGARDVLGLQAVRQDDGRLVLLAHDAMDAIVLIRFLPDGTLDPTFGTSGIVITGGITARCGGEGLALLGDGGIAVAGHLFSAGHYDMAVFKYRTTGDLDPAFATAGVAAFHTVDDADAHAIAVDARGRIVAAGEVQHLQRLGMVMRLLPDGRSDPAFGAGGVVTSAGIPPADHDSTFRAVACQADGAVLVAGQSPSPTLLHPPITTVGALARFAEDGEPDRDFGAGGLVLSDRTSGASGEAFTGMLVRTDGRIVALAGTAQQLILCGFRSAMPAYLDLVADAPTLSTVELTWTSPVAVGVSYEVRYARTPITEATWTAATRVPGVPPAQAPGSTEHVTVNGLASGTTWYFAYRSIDRAGGRSALSRVAGATTLRIDQVRPAAVVAAGGISHTGELLFGLTFSEPVTGLALDHLQLAGAASATLTGGGQTWNLTVVPVGAGTVTVTVPWGAAVDAAGNGNSPASAQEFYAPALPGGALRAPGLTYAYFEGAWPKLPEFAFLQAAAVGIAPRIDLGPSRRPTLFGLRFTGYVLVPADGVYTFSALSDDGSSLALDGVPLIANDGHHPAVERSADIALPAGLHALAVDYFQGGGGSALVVSYAGPGLVKQPIPAAALSHDQEALRGILREYWTGIVGRSVATLIRSPAYPLFPSGTSLEPEFSAPVDWADSYGTRMRGYVYPPLTGDYTFWVAGDDTCELWLSATGLEDDKALIANVPSATAPRAWETWPQQRSAPIHLLAGNAYYIEALQKEAGGGDSLAVGWWMPDGTLERPIPGIRLSPPLSGVGWLPPPLRLARGRP